MWPGPGLQHLVEEGRFQRYQRSELLEATDQDDKWFVARPPFQRNDPRTRGFEPG